MNTETALTTTNTDLITQHGDNLEVSAFTPHEMLNANQALIAWCEQKIAAVKSEASELLAAFKQAVEKKWKSSTLKRHADLAAKRVTFYEKIKVALEEGFYIVPNFPVDLFAIRTERAFPARKLVIGTYKASGWHFKQPAQLLPAGEGEYKPTDPLVTTSVDTHKEGDKTVTKYIEQATEWGDIEFPVQMAKPKIMEAVSRAMALKIFDQFGLFSQTAGDPIIVGEIIDPRSAGYQAHNNKRRVSFIIAWRLDTKDL